LEIRIRITQDPHVVRPWITQDILFLKPNSFVQALRGCVTSSGDKLSPAIRKPMIQSQLSLISHVEDSSRLAASGCLAALIKWLPEEERSPILTETVLDDNKSRLEA
jgi:hypothetical protein